MADLRRRSRQHALLAARSDQRGQLQQARGRLALQDRQPRAAARVQLRVHAADGRAASSTSTAGIAPRRRRARRGDRRDDVDAQRATKGTRGEAAPRQLSGRGLAYWTDGRERQPHPLRHARLPAGRARREDRRAGPRLRQERHRRSEARGRSGRWISSTARSACMRRRSSRRTSSSSAPRTCPAACRRAGRTRRATSAASTCGRGKRLWIFHTIPQPGEFGNDTWEKDSWSYTGNAGVWAQMSVDEELGLVYLPVELPTGDYYGGHRPGNGLFGESLVAVDLQTGQAQVALPARAPRHLGHGHPVRADPRRTSPSTAERSRRSRSRPSRAGSTCSIARPGSRSGRSKSGRSRRATCPANGMRRRSRSPPSRRRSIARASRSTI